MKAIGKRTRKLFAVALMIFAVILLFSSVSVSMHSCANDNCILCLLHDSKGALLLSVIILSFDILLLLQKEIYINKGGDRETLVSLRSKISC